MHRIDIAVVDFVPQGFEFLLLGIVVQTLVHHFCLAVGIFHHIVQSGGIKDALNQFMHLLFNGLQFFAHRSQSTLLHIGMIVLQNVAFLINIVIIEQITYDAGSLLLRNGVFLLAHFNGNPFEIIDRGLCRTFTQSVFGLFLQSINERTVVLVGDDGQFVGVMYGIAQAFLVHAVAVIINADSQTATDFLPFGGAGIGVTQRADLEHIGIVPTFAQGRMGEDESCRLIETQQAFFVLQNQVVSRDVVRCILAAFHLTINRMAFLVDGEIAVVYLCSRETTQVSLIIVLKQSQVFVQIAIVFILKHLPQRTLHLVPVRVIALVVGHLVDEEQRKGLDALLEQGSFLLKMRLDGFPNLYQLDGFLADIAHHLALTQLFAVLEIDRVRQRVDFRDDKILVGRKLRNGKQRIALLELAKLSAGGSGAFHLDFKPDHRCVVLRKDDAVEIDVTLRAQQVLHRDALHLDFLHQALFVGIVGIQRIDAVVRSLVGGGIVEHKQRLEVAQGLLGGFAFHLLRLVHNDDRTVGGNHVNGTAALEIVAFGVDDTCLLVGRAFLERGVEGLHVDNHHVDAGIAAERVDLGEVGAVVDEIAGFLAVEFHKMLFQHGEALINALTDGDAGHYYDELRPAEAFVHLEHGLDIDVGLARARLHLHIQRAGTEAVGGC